MKYLFLISFFTSSFFALNAYSLPETCAIVLRGAYHLGLKDNFDYPNNTHQSFLNFTKCDFSLQKNKVPSCSLNVKPITNGFELNEELVTSYSEEGEETTEVDKYKFLFLKKPDGNEINFEHLMKVDKSKFAEQKTFSGVFPIVLDQSCKIKSIGQFSAEECRKAIDHFKQSKGSDPYKGKHVAQFIKAYENKSYLLFKNKFKTNAYYLLINACTLGHFSSTDSMNYVNAMLSDRSKDFSVEGLFAK